MDPDPDPITAKAAAAQLGRSPITIRQWARRYQARQLGTVDRVVFYDYRDLATIDGCIARGDDIPATPELRDQLRADLRARFQDAA
ncbi:hypothetical protein [Nonomuraea guangzhouensis]|uniref:Helix-turn-helix domain-containing protein n=1 Tax=Nonomuraea guangzhouensis TaxID=1291555 RepID=A0ABW4GVU6_9ACTN|nr:hypothetical protein [Nonomuraea guangzhouensis]